MQSVRLENTPITVSKFIFGTASLFNCGGAKFRQNLLAAAVDAGFSHFDTAPYYGFGFAERDLAPVLKRHPDVTVTTKVGIYSPVGEGQSSPHVLLRKAMGHIAPAISRPAVDFTLTRAKRSLEGSLRRLGRDAIDIYTLHEPRIDMLSADEWLRWLEDLVAAGKVRLFGIAAMADRLEPFLAADVELARFVQVADSLQAREADVLTRYGRPLQVTYGYVTAARASPAPVDVAETLARALVRNPKGAIIVSTTKPARLKQYTRLTEGAA